MSDFNAIAVCFAGRLSSRFTSDYRGWMQRLAVACRCPGGDDAIGFLALNHMAQVVGFPPIPVPPRDVYNLGFGAGIPDCDAKIAALDWWITDLSTVVDLAPADAVVVALDGLAFDMDFPPFPLHKVPPRAVA